MQTPETNDHAADATSPTEVEESAVEWLRGELDDTNITGSDNFLDIGGYSLMFSRLNRFLRESHGIVLDMRATYAEPLNVAVTKTQSVNK
ncbi:hypothetical protein [Actinophytocola sp.]|uniref:hypothetical protein n=1 Tax=Actinophytocola sp. TaxID=1872138 RepID=UPI003D6A9C4F